MWVYARDFEDMYQVSDDGLVRGIDRVYIRKNGRKMTTKGRLKAYGINKNGYYTVQLSKAGKKYTFLVHKLIWESFNGKIPEDSELEVCHYDENNKNNRLDNLYLGTHEQNCQQKLFRERRSKAMKGNTYSKGKFSKNRIPIVCLDLNGNLIKEYDCLSDVTSDGFSTGNVCKCCKNTYYAKGNVTKNRIFMYKSDFIKANEVLLD